MNILCPCKSYSKMCETEPRYNNPRYNDIPDITMRIQRTKGKIFPYITILSVHSNNLIKQNIEFNTVIEKSLRFSWIAFHDDIRK